MLPLLLGLGGSALAGTGALTALGAFGTPLAAGAIGSGLGSFLETGDLGQGIQTGLMSFLGGKALGAAFGGGAGAGASTMTGAAPVGGATAVNRVNIGGSSVNALQSVPVNSANLGAQFANSPAMTAGVQPLTDTLSQGAVSAPLKDGLGSSLAGNAGSSTGGTFSNFLQSDAIQKGVLDPGAMGAVGTAGLMGLMGGQQGGFASPDEKYIPEAKAQDRKLAAIPAGYKPGIDPELNYFQPYSLSAKGLKEGGEVPTPKRLSDALKEKLMDEYDSRKDIYKKGELGQVSQTLADRRAQMDSIKEMYKDHPELMERATGKRLFKKQEGGLTDIADNPMDVMGGAETPEMIPNDKEIINDAVDAIKGEDPQPEMALGRFLSRYGEEALQDLVQRVQSGEFDQNAQVEEGKVNGAGDGMDDLIPAKLEGEDDVVLSDGEFIVPADVVSGLGNGSSDAGSKALYDMMDRVREMRTGKKEQPKQVPQGEMLPV